MAIIPYGQKGWKPVQGTNMDYLTINARPRSTASAYTRLHDIQFVPPIGGKLSDKARDGKCAGYKIVTFYMPEARRFGLLRPSVETPWLVEVFKIVVHGSMTWRGRLPKGFKSFKHFATLAEVKDYTEKVMRKFARLKRA